MGSDRQLVLPCLRGILTLLMVTGAYAYSVQFREGLVVTGNE